MCSAVTSGIPTRPTMRPSTAESAGSRVPLSIRNEHEHEHVKGGKKRHRRSMSERHNPDSYPLSAAFFPSAPASSATGIVIVVKANNTRKDTYVAGDWERPLPPLPPPSPSSSRRRHTLESDVASSRLSSALLDSDYDKYDSIYFDINTDSPPFDLFIPTANSERRRKMERVWKTLGSGVRVADVFGRADGCDDCCGDEDEGGARYGSVDYSVGADDSMWKSVNSTSNDMDFMERHRVYRDDLPSPCSTTSSSSLSSSSPSSLPSSTLSSQCTRSAPSPLPSPPSLSPSSGAIVLSLLRRMNKWSK